MTDSDNNMTTTTERMPLGILIGGRSSRMGSAKGWLEIEGEALLHRTIRIGREAGLRPVLVGDTLEYTQALEDVSLEAIPDEPANIGPLGAVAALSRRFPSFVVVACDMPYIEAGSLERLARHSSTAQILTFDREPFPARYQNAEVERAVAAGTRSFRQLFTERQVHAITMSVAERRQLRDWDSPSDIPPSQRLKT